MVVRIICFVAFICTLLNGSIQASRHDQYKGYAIYSVWPETEAQANILKSLEITGEIDVWQHWAPDRAGKVMLSAEMEPRLLGMMRDGGLRFELEVPSVASLLENEEVELEKYRSMRPERLAFEDYPRYDEVVAYMEDLAARHPGVATVVTAGPSYEGLDVKYMKISTTNFEDDSKPVFFINAAMHSREWVTVPVTLYALHRLLDEPGETELALLRDVDFVVMPVVNPDGYEFSHTGNRVWRRSRSVNRFVETSCLGADINRNFDIMFNTIDVSSNPCSDVYPGGEAFSEVESRYLRDILYEFGSRLYFYMDIHSHGNYVLYAFDDLTLPPRVERVHLVGAAMGAAMDQLKLPAANFYLVGNSALMLYAASGTAQDYAAMTGIPLVYTLELPGLGYAFFVPPRFIDHINRETWAGLAEAAKLTKMFYDADRR